MFVLFLHCFLPLLFILEDSELVEQHPPFESLLTLQQLALLIKVLVFRIVWEGDKGVRGGLGEHLNVCRLILVELYQRDIRCDWMSEGRQQQASAARDEDEEHRVERGGKAWLIDADDGGADWTVAWTAWLQHGDSVDLAQEEANEEDERKHGHPSSATTAAARPHLRVLRVLQTLPFITPFRDRVFLFRRHLAHHRATHFASGVAELRVRRAYVIADGLAAVDYPGNIRVNSSRTRASPRRAWTSADPSRSCWRR